MEKQGFYARTKIDNCGGPHDTLKEARKTARGYGPKIEI